MQRAWDRQPDAEPRESEAQPAWTPRLQVRLIVGKMLLMDSPRNRRTWQVHHRLLLRDTRCCCSGQQLWLLTAGENKQFVACFVGKCAMLVMYPSKLRAELTSCMEHARGREQAARGFLRRTSTLTLTLSKNKPLRRNRLSHFSVRLP